MARSIALAPIGPGLTEGAAALNSYYGIHMMKKVFLLVCLLALSPLCTAKDFVISFDTEADYAKSISDFRRGIGTELTRIGNVYETSPVGDLITVSLSNDRGRQIRLVLRPRDLYVIGYEAYGIFYRFNDPEYQSLALPYAATTQLPYNMYSTYDSLSSFGDIQLSDVNVSRASVYGAIDTLSRFGDGSVNANSLSRALYPLIIAVSEGARFRPVSSAIVTALGSSTAMTLGRNTGLVRNWQQISEYALLMQQMAGSDADYYSVDINPTHSTSRHRLASVLAIALTCLPARSAQLGSPRAGAPVSENLIFDKYSSAVSCNLDKGFDKDHALYYDDEGDFTPVQPIPVRYAGVGERSWDFAEGQVEDFKMGANANYGMGINYGCEKFDSSPAYFIVRYIGEGPAPKNYRVEVGSEPGSLVESDGSTYYVRTRGDFEVSFPRGGNYVYTIRNVTGRRVIGSPCDAGLI